LSVQIKLFSRLIMASHDGQLTGKTEAQVWVDDNAMAGCGRKGLVAPKYMGTVADQRDMSVLGRVQVLRVRRSHRETVSF
jgi:hypothetical protein